MSSAEVIPPTTEEQNPLLGNALFPNGHLVDRPGGREVGFYVFDEWWPTALISVIYLVVCYYWRLAILKQKHDESKGLVKPKEYGGPHIQRLVIGYNVFLVFYSLFTCVGMWYAMYTGGWSFFQCTSKPTKESYPDRLFAIVGFVFYTSKVIELLDTIFFLVKGKCDQLTFLHVFHHVAMPISLWWGLKYAPQGMVYLFPMANSFIHVLMYTYYGLAAAGMYRYLWWKHYLTIAQMVQFVLMILHQGQIFVIPNNCDYPRAFPAAICAYSFIFLVLFGNFYIQAYLKKGREAKGYETKRKQHTNGTSAPLPVEETNGSVQQRTKAKKDL